MYTIELTFTDGKRKIYHDVTSFRVTTKPHNFTMMDIFCSPVEIVSCDGQKSYIKPNSIATFSMSVN